MMTENFHLYDEISDFLLSKQINISAKNEWLLGCCSYYSSNDTHVNIYFVPFKYSLFNYIINFFK